jgi:protein-S-isoprenylcysteine O-methyltransferase Ste14
VGFSLWAGPAALVLTPVLSVLWVLKSRVEERHLAALYPGYAAYCGRVRWRLLPFVY